MISDWPFGHKHPAANSAFCALLLCLGFIGLAAAILAPLLKHH